MKSSSVGSIIVALLLASSTGLADDLPVPYTSRPLTLPARMISPAFSASLLHVEGFGNFGADNRVGLNLGASYGITDNLTVHATPLTMSIVTSTRANEADAVYYGTLRVGGIFRFLHTEDVDIGVQLELGGAGKFLAFFATAGIPVLFRVGHVVRIDTGLMFTMSFPTTSSGRLDGALAGVSSDISGTTTQAGVPISLAIQPIDPIFFGLRTGFGIGSFRGNVANTVFVPLGAFFGGTIASSGNRPIVDVTGSFSFPVFLLGNVAELPVTQAWVVGLDARFYFQL